MQQIPDSSLFTQENDMVLDPFMGSGTTVLVANRMKRNVIGIDIVAEYCQMVETQLHQQAVQLSVSFCKTTGKIDWEKLVRFNSAVHNS